MANLHKSKYLMRNLVINQKICKKIAQIAKNYTFLTQQIQIYKNICKIPLRAYVQKSVQYFSAKIVQFACFCYRLSKEL